jgi:hypothetical protein
MAKITKKGEVGIKEEVVIGKNNKEPIQTRLP